MAFKRSAVRSRSAPPISFPFCGFLVALAAAAALPGCRSAAPAAPAEPPPGVSDRLGATLWSQTAEEAYRLRISVFRAASAALERALADPAWSALGQGAEAAALPVAVIADVDETMLDNGPFEGRMAREGRTFDEATWTAWVEAAAAPPMPGALDFGRLCAARGVKIFYVTNRDHDPEGPATLRNLAASGLPVDAPADVLLMRGERPEWGSDKSSRFAEIARGHRVLLVLGDDLNDFLAGVRDASIEERRAKAEAAAERWGTSWFVLPNPIYGSFLRAVDHGLPEGASAEERLRRKHARLEVFEGGAPPAP